MLAGAVNLPIEQLEPPRSLRTRCVTKSEPNSGQANRIQGKRDTTTPGRTKSYPLRLPPGLVLVKREALQSALPSSKVVTVPDLRMRLRQKESLAAPQGFEPR